MRRLHDPAMLNVAHWLPTSRANGPGERFVLWLQGCGLACDGCWNPDTWSFAPKHLMTAGQVMDLVMAHPGIEGVTLTGGEPFAQAAALLPLVARVRAAGLTLVIFTGYELHELRSATARHLLAAADIVVAGRYVAAKRDFLQPLRGSRNQEVVFLTDRYSRQDFEGMAEAEVLIDGVGGISMTGFPADALLATE